VGKQQRVSVCAWQITLDGYLLNAEGCLTADMFVEMMCLQVRLTCRRWFVVCVFPVLLVVVGLWFECCPSYLAFDMPTYL